MGTSPSPPSARSTDRRRPALAPLLLAAGLCTVGGCGSESGRSTAIAAVTQVPSSAATSDPTTTTAPGLTADQLTQILAADMSGLNSPGQLMTVLAPGIDVSAATGTNPDGEPIDPDGEFRIGSIGHTFTAAAILRMVEMGWLDLSTTLVDSRLSPDLLDLLRGDGYDVDAITIDELLQHTSGIFDYAHGNGSTFVAAVLADPHDPWSRKERVRAAVEDGAPLDLPGRSYHYSETGYVLLENIVERSYGTDIETAYVELLGFHRLGLEHTYIDRAGSLPPAQRVHQMYFDRDATDLDPHIDLDGGGDLVSTTHDLAVFFRALVSGEVFNDPATIDEMIRTSTDPQVARGVFLSGPGGSLCVIQGSWWGAAVATCPSAGFTFARTWLQSEAPEAWDAENANRQVYARLGITYVGP